LRAAGWAILAAVVAAVLGLALSAALRSAAPLDQQQQVLAIAADLRCPVCPGESAAAAQTPEALAMRQQIASDLAAGLDRGQILQRFEAEYGVWILYRPPVRGAYLLLWLVPLAGLGGVGAALRGVLRRTRRGRAPDPPPAAAEVPREVARRLGRFL